MTTDAEAAGEGSYGVFISFARPSGRGDAIALRAYLNGQGITAFVDEKDVIIGDPWYAQVRAAHSSARVTVVCVTVDILTSPHALGEVFNAIDWARSTDRVHRVVPWIRPSAPPKTEWPSGLRTYQGHDGDVPTVAQLIVHRLLRPERCPAPVEPAEATTVPVTVTVDTARDAVLDAEALLLELLCDPGVRLVAAEALGVAEVEVLPAFLARPAADVVRAFDAAELRLGTQGNEGRRRAFRAVLTRVLPYLVEWAALSAQARSCARDAMRVELPVRRASIAEIMLAGLDQRAVCFLVVGGQLRPQHLISLTPAARAFRTDPAVLGALTEQQVYRRAGRLMRAIPELEAAMGGVAASFSERLPAGEAGLDELAEVVELLDGRLHATRTAADEDQRACWSVLVHDQGDSGLWEAMLNGMSGVLDLRLVRLSGGAGGPSTRLVGTIEEQLKQLISRNP